MPQIFDPTCPDCGKSIIDTRTSIQPYNDFDEYVGFRCSGCFRTFTNEEIAEMANTPSAQ